LPARLTLYGRSYCHLCEDMAQALRGLQESLEFSFEVVDVDADAATEARYGELVPVLTDAQGGEICHYFLDIAALRARLAVK
jgi:thiol-disulfide isomerase/thioredoxin